jgi:CheY-like chemotaxis protein
MPKQILLVEDSVTMQKVVQIAFAREDYQITAVTSADEALARIKEATPDVVVADAGLTGKSGYDLAAAIRADGAAKEVPILLLTSNFSPYDEGRGKAAGVDIHLVKPFDCQSIIDRVNNLVKGGRGAAATAATSGPKPAATQAPATQAPVVQAPALQAPRQTPVHTPVAQAQAPAAPAALAEPRPPAAATPPAPAVGTPNLRPPAPAPTPTPAAPPARKEPAHAAPISSPVVTTSAPASPASSEGARMPEPTRASTPASQAGSSAIPAQVPQMPRPSLIPRAPVPATVLAALEKIAARGAEFEAIAKMSAETIQQVAWEVVPELAEAILRAEADKLAAAGKERRA